MELRYCPDLRSAVQVAERREGEGVRGSWLRSEVRGPYESHKGCNDDHLGGDHGGRERVVYFRKVKGGWAMMGGVKYLQRMY